MSEWQPMATAPRDSGTYVVIGFYCGNGQFCAVPARWVTGDIWQQNDGIHFLPSPNDLWTPVPAPSVRN